LAPRDEGLFSPAFPLLEEDLEVLEDFEDGVLEAAMSKVRINVYQERRRISLKEHKEIEELLKKSFFFFESFLFS
jgi:hypothetical protein